MAAAPAGESLSPSLINKARFLPRVDAAVGDGWQKVNGESRK